MRAFGLAFCVVVVGAVVAAGLPLRAQAGIEPGSGTSRYRVEVVRVDVPAASVGRPLTLTELGGEIPGAVRPRSARLRETGEFLSVPYPHRLLEALSARGEMKVIFSAETEVQGGVRARLAYGQRFPVHSVDYRGDDTYVTTRFEKVGVEASLTGRGAEAEAQHDFEVEFSAISAHTERGQPILCEMSASGVLNLPDGHTAVLMFLDRVPVQVLRTGEDAGADAGDAGQDAVVQYFVLLTRVDLQGDS